MRRVFQRPFQALLAAVVLFLCLVSCQAPRAESSPTATPPIATSPIAAAPDKELSASPAQLPPLPYDYAALEPYIDAATMKLHHDKHHATYVDNLNNALKNQSNLKNRSIEDLLRNLNSVPEDIRTTIRNNGGGHLNHSMFWQIMAPNSGGQPTGELAQAINKTFGSFDNFKKQFNEAGTRRFGSGWVWLVRNKQGQLQITTTPNQDSPVMEGAYPILGNDVWEHAYYLKYQNRRAEYLNNWWNVVNWQAVNRRYAQAMAMLPAEHTIAQLSSSSH